MPKITGMKSRVFAILSLSLGVAALALVGVTQEVGAERAAPPVAAKHMPFVPGSAASGASSPSGEKHPGEIAYDDKIEGRKYSRQAADVLRAMAWVQVGDKWKAVVRIELSGSPERRTTTKIGADGTVLETTVQTPRVGPLPPT